MPLPVLDSTGSSSTAQAGAGARARWTAASAGSWDNLSRWSTGVTPKTGSRVEFSDSSTSVTNPGFASETTCFDIRVMNDYRGSIGTSSTPVEISASKLVLDSADADVFLKGSYGDIHINTMPNQLALSSVRGGGARRLFVRDINTELVFNSYRVDEIFVEVPGATVNIGSSVERYSTGDGATTGPQRLVVGRGTRVVCDAPLGEARVAGALEVSDEVLTLNQIRDATQTTLTGGTSRLTSVSGILGGEVKVTGGRSSNIGTGTLFGGRLVSDRTAKFVVSNMLLGGPTEFRLSPGQTITVS